MGLVVNRNQSSYHGIVKLSRLLAALLGVVVGVFPIAPPEHMHETEEEGHAHVLVHRHSPVHELFDDHDDPPETLDHNEGPAHTLSSVYNVPNPVLITGPVLIVTAQVEPPEPRRLERSSTDVEILIHGPPRAPTGLRAPPFLPTT